MKKILLALSIILLFNACGLNQNPPSYIKEVVAYKEGSDGLVVYFVLADSNGQPTTASGKININILGKTSFDDKDYELFSRSYDVSISDFRETKVGRGSFERKVILYSFGRIPYLYLNVDPQRMYSEKLITSRGKVIIEFETQSGRKLSGEDTISW